MSEDNQKTKRIYLLFLVFIVVSSFTNSGWCGQIIYPWRASTAIVLAGESFEVWFDADDGQTIASVELKGPYNIVYTTMSVEIVDVEYDPLSQNRYNTRITVTVPENAPADRYDLVLKTSTGNVNSWGGVKVITEFKDDYYIMHMSDGHIYQPGYDPITLLARKSAMIDIANIMDCQLIIETGDNMYNVRNHPDREENYFRGIESEGIRGMADASAATYLVPGDHDAYTANDWPQASVQVNSDFFNDYWGLQNSCFMYGKGRFMMLNNAWAVSVTSGKDHQYQTDDAVSWLSNSGSGGNFFLTAGHCYDKMHEFIDDYEKLDLVLAGDKHHRRTGNPYEFDPGSAKVAYIAGSIRDHFEFNLFRVNDSTGTYTPVPGVTSVANVLYSGNQDTRDTWVPNLTLMYSNKNNGSFAENTATIVNNFSFPIFGAKVRFVMPKGFNYEFTNATLGQQFEGDLFQIVDVSFDLLANSTLEIYIRADDLCLDDPDKTEPGLCGCGVPEGTCPSHPLIVNNGSGDGSYQPFEVATITADPAADGMEFYSWVTNSGSPSIADTSAIITTLTLGDEPASITASYMEIPKINSSTFISQEVPTWAPGETISVSVTMKNTGTSTWSKEDGYNLGSQGPQDNEVWGLSRVELDEGEQIKPNEEKTFSFNINVPVESGLYIFQWQMIEENIEWFGSKSIAKPIRIGDEGFYLDDCDKLTDWKSSTSLVLNSYDNLQGSNCLEFTGSGNDEYKKAFSPPYFSGGSLNSLLLQFWYYTSDASKMGVNQVELGSSGTNDKNEYNWSLTGLSTGWNFISLSISDATVMGTPNLNAVTWFRIYNKKSGSITTRLDAIEIIDPNAGERYSLVVDNGIGDGNYYSGSIISISAGTAPAGKVFDKWTVNSGTPTIENEASSATLLTMSANDVVISATYKADPNVSVDTHSEHERSINIYPNPAREEVNIDLSLENPSVIKVSILDICGRDVGLHIEEQNLNSGHHILTIPLSNIKPGTYMSRIQINKEVYTGLMLIN